MTASFVLLSDETLAAPAASMTATVDTAYRMFRVTFYGIKDGSAGALRLRLNGDSGTNYIIQGLLADSTTLTGGRTSATQTSIYAPNSTLTANNPAMFLYEIEKPLTTTPARVTFSSAVLLPNLALGSQSAEWANTADLIDEITVSASTTNFAIGSRMLIEGAAP
jgi:hypothetical protein